ncbi:LuxR C-terminal-related transcriptional regulator [Labrys neptuniae]
MTAISNAPVGTPVEQKPISVICKDALLCQCLMLGIAHRGYFDRVVGFTDPAEWVASEICSSSTIVLWISDASSLDKMINDDLDILREKAPNVTVIIISTLTNTYAVINALRKGVKGYVTSDSDLDVLLGAIRLVRAGGVYAPTNSLKELSTTSTFGEEPDNEAREKEATRFTAREMTIIRLLRLGDPNKTIARKMNLTEGTIKLHVGTIMRKIGAQNRTQVVYFTNRVFKDP